MNRRDPTLARSPRDMLSCTIDREGEEDELAPAAGGDDAAESLDSDIDAVFADLAAESAEEPAPARDPQGRFAPKAATSEETGEAPGAPGAAHSPKAAPKQDGAAPVGAPAPSNADAPPPWFKPADGDWMKLPAQTRAAIAARDAQVHRYASDVGRQLKAFEPASAAMAHLADEFKARGPDAPGKFLANLVGVEKMLFDDAQSPEPSLAPLQWLAENYYGVPLAELIAQAAPAASTAPVGDPLVTKLSQRLERLEQGMTEREQQDRDAQKAKLRAEFEDFAKDKPWAKDPAVIPIMQRLLASRQASTFAEAYDQACRLHPPAFDALQKQQRREVAERARAAAISPRRMTPTPGAKRAGHRNSIEDDVDAVFAELQEG